MDFQPKSKKMAKNNDENEIKSQRVMKKEKQRRHSDRQKEISKGSINIILAHK